MGLFKRYLSVWVAAAIATSVGLGVLVPGLSQSVAGMEFAHVNLVVAVFMIFVALQHSCVSLPDRQLELYCRDAELRCSSYYVRVTAADNTGSSAPALQHHCILWRLQLAIYSMKEYRKIRTDQRHTSFTSMVVKRQSSDVKNSIQG